MFYLIVIDSFIRVFTFQFYVEDFGKLYRSVCGFILAPIVSCMESKLPLLPSAETAALSINAKSRFVSRAHLCILRIHSALQINDVWAVDGSDLVGINT